MPRARCLILFPVQLVLLPAKVSGSPENVGDGGDHGDDIDYACNWVREEDDVASGRNSGEEKEDDKGFGRFFSHWEVHHGPELGDVTFGDPDPGFEQGEIRTRQRPVERIPVVGIVRREGRSQAAERGADAGTFQDLLRGWGCIW